MRILHITPGYFPFIGGAETHIRELSERLAQRGHDVTVFTTFGRGENEEINTAVLKATETLNGVKVQRFRPYNGIKRVLRLLWTIPGTYRMLRWLFGSEVLQLLYENPVHPGMLLQTLCFKADVITVVDWSNSLAWEIAEARRISRFPLVALPLFHTEEPWSRSSLFPRMITRCERVLVNTRFEQTFVLAINGGRQNVHVTGVGVDPEACSKPEGKEFRRRHGLNNLLIVGYIGRIAGNKGVADVLRAMQLVWRDRPETRLVVAGYKPAAGSSAGKEVDEAIDSLSEKDRSRIILLYDFAESDKASLIDAFDLFAMPSVGESFGIAYLEAWLGRKPVIGARIGTTKCIINDGVDGMLVDPRDVGALAGALRLLLDNSDLRKRMGQAGYEKVMSCYTWRSIVDVVEDIYKSLQYRNSGIH